MSPRILLGILTIAGCANRPAPVPSATSGDSVALSAGFPFLALELPPDSRDGRAPPERIVPAGEWIDQGQHNTHRDWTIPVPIRMRSFFFNAAPQGVSVVDTEGTPVPFSHRLGGWSFTETDLVLHLPLDAPQPHGWAVLSARATQREERLNLKFSGLSPEEFARAQVQVGNNSRSGVLLPAPATAIWEFTCPNAAELHFAPGLVPPEVSDGPASDGATLNIEVLDGTEVHSVW